ncbi:MAG: prepilin-type N-terminal cleavage/methylation domain-containing protein [Thermodesulfobacteriota bacterium]|nr:prepilin-type N-terminal cleavage/methylation domain-containing protein [Thermodesulfobacteriota bacterium]
MRKLSINNQQGFSLIEAMIAMVILSVGLMAVGLMQIGAMKGNTNALGRSDGVVMAQSVMDTLRCLPLGDDLLDDNGSDLDAGKADGGVFDDTLADHTAVELMGANPVTGANGQNYTIFWNIADNDIDADGDAETKNIRLFVYWNDQKFGLNRVVVTSVLGGLYL